MTWGFPNALWLLLLLPLMGLGLVHAHRARSRDLATLLGAGLLDRDDWAGLARRRALQSVLLLLCVACAVVALAQPQAGAEFRPTQSEQAQVVLALDLSRSMNAQDVVPSRLERARRDAEALVDVLPGDRVGLVIFAAGAYPRAPLTTDRKVLSTMIAQSRTEALRAQGSSLAAALKQSLDLLSEEGAGAQAIVLITDGEDHRPKALEQAVAQVQARQIPVFVLAVGTEQGSPIPMASGDFKRGPDGQVVLSRLNPQTLEALAQATGGSFTESVAGDQDTLAIAADLERALTRQLGTVQQERIPRQVFQLPLALALLLGLVATAMRDQPALRLRGVVRPIAAAGLLLVLPWTADAQDPALQQLLEREQYVAALTQAQQGLAEDPDSLDLLWAQGEALYGLGQYEAAGQIFEQIGAGARHRPTRQQARLNASRAYYQAGKLEAALGQNQAVLIEDQEHPVAKANVEQLTRELAMRLEPPPPEEPPPESEEQQEQPESGEQDSEPQEPEQGEGEAQQPQQGEGQGQGEEQDPGATPESGEQPDPGPQGGQDESDTGISEQAEGQSGEGQPSQDDGLQEARAEQGEGQVGTQQEEGEQDGEDGPSQPLAGSAAGEEPTPETPAQQAAREILESVEEGSPRAAYGGKGGGRDW